MHMAATPPSCIASQSQSRTPHSSSESVDSYDPEYPALEARYYKPNDSLASISLQLLLDSHLDSLVTALQPTTTTTTTTISLDTTLQPPPPPEVANDYDALTFDSLDGSSPLSNSSKRSRQQFESQSTSNHWNACSTSTNPTTTTTTSHLAQLVDVEQIIPVSSNKRHCTAVLSTSSASIASLADDIDTLSAQAKPHRPPVIKPQLPPIATPTTTATAAAAAEATDIKPKPRPKSVAAFNTASATKTHSSTPPSTKTHSSTPPLTKTHSSTPPSTKTPPTSTHSAAKQLNTSSAAFLAAAAKAAAKAAASCNAVSSVPKSLQAPRRAAAATRSASTHPVLERLRTKAMQEATAARKLSHQEQAQYHVEYTNQLKASCSNTPKRTVFVARVAGSAVSAVTRNAMLDRLIQLYSSAASEASDIDAIHRKV
jgi:hypothetical protein